MSDNAGSSNKKERTLYLIVYKDIMERILNGEKTIEYRDCGEYWDKRIENRVYDKVKITNGYGNDTRPYVLLKYNGYQLMDYQGKPHYAIPINRTLWSEYREEINGEIKYVSNE